MLDLYHILLSQIVVYFKSYLTVTIKMALVAGKDKMRKDYKKFK